MTMATLAALRRVKTIIALPALALALLAASGCDIVTGHLSAQETAEWRKSYELKPGGRLEVSNVNGRIEVQPSSGNSVEVVAQKIAKGSSEEAARAALGRIEIAEHASGNVVKIETRLPRSTGFLHMGNTEVRYTIRVPASTELKFTTVNGAIELAGLSGKVTAETTNGGIRARDVNGSIEASTVNGGVDVELGQVPQEGVRLSCTNGGIRLKLPSDAKASIFANVTNGGIDTQGLAIDATESTRRRLEGRMNGGGPAIRIDGTNGGIRISPR